MNANIDRQIACVEREVVSRRRVYPCLVQDGNMSKAKADEEIAVMADVLDTLRTLKTIADFYASRFKDVVGHG